MAEKRGEGYLKIEDQINELGIYDRKYGLTPSQLETLLGTHLLSVIIGRDFGALKGLM